MKVLIINTFHEGTSTAKIATGLYNRLVGDGHECRLLYGSGVISNNKDFIKVATSFDIRLQWCANQLTGIHGNFAPFAMQRVYRIIEEFGPDIVQLYNLHFYYLNIYALFDYLKKKQIKTVYSMLDEYPYLGYCCYAYNCEQFKTGCHSCNYKQFRKTYPRNFFRNGAEKTVCLKEKAYKDFSDLIFTGPKWVLERAEESYLLHGKRLREVDEYVDTKNTFFPVNTVELRKELEIKTEQIVILNVAPSSDPRKGVHYYLDLAKEVKDDKIVFIHVGYQGNTDNLPANFIPIPFVKEQKKLAQFYALADLFVCTSIADTMPNVCLDSLACGTPIMGFKITGIPYVAEEPLGKFVEVGNIDAMIQIVKSIDKKTEEQTKACREYAVARYSPEAYYKGMMNIYRELFKKDGE